MNIGYEKIEIKGFQTAKHSTASNFYSLRLRWRHRFPFFWDQIKNCLKSYDFKIIVISKWKGWYQGYDIITQPYRWTLWQSEDSQWIGNRFSNVRFILFYFILVNFMFTSSKWKTIDIFFKLFSFLFLIFFMHKQNWCYSFTFAIP